MTTEAIRGRSNYNLPPHRLRAFEIDHKHTGEKVCKLYFKQPTVKLLVIFPFEKFKTGLHYHGCDTLLTSSSMMKQSLVG